MSFDAKVDELIDALNRNTAALEAAAGAGASGGGKSTKAEGTSGKAGAGKGTSGKSTKKAVTEDDVKAAAVALKDKFGTAEAKKVIKSAGKANSLAEIEEDNYEAFVKAAQAKLEEGDGDGDGDGDGL